VQQPRVDQAEPRAGAASGARASAWLPAASLRVTVPLRGSSVVIVPVMLAAPARARIVETSTIFGR